MAFVFDGKKGAIRTMTYGYLRGIDSAMNLYLSDHQETFPPAANGWIDPLVPYVSNQDPGFLLNPSGTHPRDGVGKFYAPPPVGFGFNTALYSLNRTQIENPDRIYMVIENHDPSSRSPGDPDNPVIWNGRVWVVLVAGGLKSMSPEEFRESIAKTELRSTH